MPEDKDSEVKAGGVDFSKRAFIKTALIGGVAIASGAVIAKKLSSNTSNTRLAQAYVDDDLQQEKVMKDKQFVVMTRKEKDKMIEMLVGDYSYKA